MEKATANLELISKYFPRLSPRQLEQMAALEELYKDWNRKINIISRKDIDNIYRNHVLHSLSIAAAFKFENGTEILDIGTGGGFPGIPLAIFFPASRFHLVDSIGKKIKVVEAIAAAVGLTNLSAEHTRAEKITKKKFDAAVSRAVAPLKELWHWSKPLLNKSKNRESYGLLCLKGGDLSMEISDCGCHPRILDIQAIFREEYFRQKFILQVQV
ncbi:MAG TPA: 16S rRNA (guanine(527)-N(7))-methyltransferase RsmG [Puia sp.]|jgi:16S rRNA (guanine527-N7)-methyltransferase|nr:16S rRNA (guanine(527)-N(7))-methyltransferase RsmG [Puia sp.]